MRDRPATVAALGKLIQERETITAAIRAEIASRQAAVSASADALDESRTHLAAIRVKVRRLCLPLVGRHDE